MPMFYRQTARNSVMEMSHNWIDNRLLKCQVDYSSIMTEYCCREFEKSVDYDDFCYYRAKEDSYNAITKDGWYMRDAQFNRPIASLEPFRYCPWSAKQLKK
jgi:hypothetical protein